MCLGDAVVKHVRGRAGLNAAQQFMIGLMLPLPPHASLASPSDSEQHAERLRAIFGDPGWARFVATLRELRDAGRAPPARFTLPAPTDAERRRHASLLRLAQPSQASRLSYDLAALADALARAGLPTDWGVITESVCGPITTEARARLDQEQAWAQLWPDLQAEFAPERFAGQLAWLEKLRRDGVLRKLLDVSPATAAPLLRDAARLLQALPLSPEQALARVAARFFGDSHALDTDRPLANLVVRGLALRSNILPPTRARERRELWESAGVICDELSAPVLTFNLGLIGDDPLVPLADVARAAGQPLHLSTRLLWSVAWEKLTPPPQVFICENPAIVALAADALGSRCAPLVCVNGEPKTAAWVLLRALRDCGASLHYHGDFDCGGLAIAGRVMREVGALPWRYDAEAYAAAHRHPARPLSGKPVPTPWSPALSADLLATRKAYDEEALADDLLADLSAS